MYTLKVKYKDGPDLMDMKDHGTSKFKSMPKIGESICLGDVCDEGNIYRVLHTPNNEEYDGILYMRKSGW